MKTYILKESDISNYYEFAVKDCTCIEESKLKAAAMGLCEVELDEAKKISSVGDCFLLEYDNKLLPFQVLHKKDNGNVILSSYYVLDNHIFDENTNVWRDSSIRKYMNNDMASKFGKDLLKKVVDHDVHTDNYVTKDKFWLLSHEEIGYKDENGMFKPNVGAETFDYYKKNDAGDNKDVA